MEKYYVVFQGHNPGIYLTYEDYTEQMKGYRQCIGRVYKTIEEARTAYGLGVKHLRRRKVKYYVINGGPNQGIYNSYQSYARRLGDCQESCGKIFSKEARAIVFLNSEITPDNFNAKKQYKTFLTNNKQKFKQHAWRKKELCCCITKMQELDIAEQREYKRISRLNDYY